MAFNKALPDDTTKIRNYPSVLTGNFAGIQEADSTFIPQALNLADRTAAALATPPPRIDNTMILYSDTVGSNAELFVEDAQNPANQIQITEDSYLGGASQAVSCSSISFDGGTTSMNKIHQVSGWARVAANGALTASSGTISVAKAATGLYTITLSPAAATATFCGMATCANTTSRRSITCENYTATSFQVRIYSNSDGNNNDEPFQVVVFGGR